MNALKFTQEDIIDAYDQWGANCGPVALAAVLGLTLDAVRPHLDGFEGKRYMNPSMMKNALRSLGASWKPKRWLFSFSEKDFPDHGLVRIQFTGPWTDEGANPRWAYRHTHWIATCREEEQVIVYDINGGLEPFPYWSGVTVPLLIPPRGDGGWYPTHLWEVSR